MYLLPVLVPEYFRLQWENVPPAITYFVGNFSMINFRSFSIASENYLVWVLIRIKLSIEMKADLPHMRKFYLIFPYILLSL